MEIKRLSSLDQPLPLPTNMLHLPNASRHHLSSHYPVTRDDLDSFLIPSSLPSHAFSTDMESKRNLQRILNDPSRLTDSASFVTSRLSNANESLRKPSLVPRKQQRRPSTTVKNVVDIESLTTLDPTPSAHNALVDQLSTPLPLHYSNPITPLFQEDLSPEHTLSCVVCFSTSADDMRTCPLCFISTCHECFSNWLDIRIHGGHSTELTCLKCISPIPPEEVRAYCGERLYKKHLYYLSKEQHRDNPYAVWCPNDGCWGLLQDSKRNVHSSVKELRCPDCDAVLCAKCFSFAHDDDKCPSPQFMLGQRALVHFWQRIHTKKCPKCSVRIQRAGGCSQMRCVSCQTKFCWRCRGLLHTAMLNEFGETNLRLCICPKTTRAVIVIAAAGGALVALPLVLAATVVVGPPALVGYIALPPEKKAHIRLKISTFINRL